MPVNHAPKPTSLCKRKRTDSGTMITTEVSAPVLKPTNNPVYKHRMNAHPPIEKNKLDKTSRILIWFEGLGYCCNTLRYISLDIAMDEISFLRKVWQKFHLPREAADVKIALVLETTQDVEWRISSKQGDETGWPDYRVGLFEKKDGRGICDGVYAVVSCSDSYSIFCKDLQSSCSREGEYEECRDGKGRGLWARGRRGT
jgi:hypothetical protein